MCLISFWYQAFKCGESNDKAMQPAAGLGQRSVLICIGCVCFLAHIAQRSTKMMVVITSILPLRKVKCREMTWQQLHTRLVASKEKSVSLGFVLPSPGFIDF